MNQQDAQSSVEQKLWQGQVIQYCFNCSAVTFHVMCPPNYWTKDIGSSFKNNFSKIYIKREFTNMQKYTHTHTQKPAHCTKNRHRCCICVIIYIFYSSALCDHNYLLTYIYICPYVYACKHPHISIEDCMEMYIYMSIYICMQTPTYIHRRLFLCIEFL